MKNIFLIITIGILSPSVFAKDIKKPFKILIFSPTPPLKRPIINFNYSRPSSISDAPMLQIKLENSKKKNSDKNDHSVHEKYKVKSSSQIIDK